jgi:hypothetical protein
LLVADMHKLSIGKSPNHGEEERAGRWSAQNDEPPRTGTAQTSKKAHRER